MTVFPVSVVARKTIRLFLVTYLVLRIAVRCYVHNFILYTLQPTRLLPYAHAKCRSTHSRTYVLDTTAVVIRKGAYGARVRVEKRMRIYVRRKTPKEILNGIRTRSAKPEAAPAIVSRMSRARPAWMRYYTIIIGIEKKNKK